MAVSMGASSGWVSGPSSARPAWILANSWLHRPAKCSPALSSPMVSSKSFSNRRASLMAVCTPPTTRTASNSWSMKLVDWLATRRMVSEEKEPSSHKEATEKIKRASSRMRMLMRCM